MPIFLVIPAIIPPDILRDPAEQDCGNRQLVIAAVSDTAGTLASGLL